MIRYSRVLCLTAACLIACGDGQTGTHIGNPTSTAGFNLTASQGDSDASSGPLTFVDDGGTVYTLTHARTSVRDIELDLPAALTCADVSSRVVGATCVADDSGGFKIVIAGPFVVDLIDRTATPSLDGVRIPAIVYQRVDVRIDDADPDDGLIAPGDELDDRSLVARADFEYDQNAAELELSLRFNEDIRFEDPAGVPVPEASQLLAQLDVTDWLAGLAIGQCLDDGDLEIAGGRLVIDDDAGQGNCSDVEGSVRANIEVSGRLAVAAIR